MQVVQRHYCYLNAQGLAEVGREQMVVLREHEDEPPALRDQIKLRIPGLCSLRDEVPLMPMKAEAHREYALEVERYREPIRDRDKNWRLDSQRAVLGERITVLAGPRDRPRPC